MIKGKRLALATMGAMSHPIMSSFGEIDVYDATNTILTAQNTTGGEVIVGQPETFKIPDIEPIPYVNPHLYGFDNSSKKQHKPNTGFKIGSYNSRSKNKSK